MAYPMDAGERQVLRAQLMQRAIEQAVARANEANRSLKCGAGPDLYRGWKHATDPDGCQANASQCLCECHDPVPAEGVAGDEPVSIHG